MRQDEINVLKAVYFNGGGAMVWDRNATILMPRSGGRPGLIRRRNPPPEAAMRRLVAMDMIDVESHNISPWKGSKKQYRTEIVTELTPTGTQYCQTWFGLN